MQLFNNLPMATASWWSDRRNPVAFAMNASSVTSIDTWPYLESCHTLELEYSQIDSVAFYKEASRPRSAEPDLTTTSSIRCTFVPLTSVSGSVFWIWKALVWAHNYLDNRCLQSRYRTIENIKSRTLTVGRVCIVSITLDTYTHLWRSRCLNLRETEPSWQNYISCNVGLILNQWITAEGSDRIYNWDLFSYNPQKWIQENISEATADRSIWAVCVGSE